MVKLVAIRRQTAKGGTFGADSRGYRVSTEILLLDYMGVGAGLSLVIMAIFPAISDQGVLHMQPLRSAEVRKTLWLTVIRGECVYDM